MPHYHNFGWYYFAKYILGLAGMIILYTGFLKEKSVLCVCPAEEREHVRRKNNPKRSYRCSCQNEQSQCRACGCEKRERSNGDNDETKKSEQKCSYSSRERS